MILEEVLNFFYPKKNCMICLKKGKFPICDNCIKRIERCEEINVIHLHNRYLDELIYYFRYKNLIRKLILQYKFKEKFFLGEVFSKIIVKNEKICGKLKFYDIIVPVPMYMVKRNERGYNQTEILAKYLAKTLDVKYDKNILLKKVENKRQSSLSQQDRYKNVKNVFKVENKDRIINKKVILVDDVCTTSATLEECSKILKLAGAKVVTRFSYCKRLKENINGRTCRKYFRLCQSRLY